MPFVSGSQQRWGNSPAGKKALGGQAKVDEWNNATDQANLPDKAQPPKPKGGALRGMARKAISNI